MQVVLYVSALAAWIMVACIIWCAAGFMFLASRTRSSAWPMSLAMASTFPFVFAYQIMALPAVIVMLLFAAGFFDGWRAGWRLGHDREEMLRSPEAAPYLEASGSQRGAASARSSDSNFDALPQ